MRKLFRIFASLILVVAVVSTPAPIDALGFLRADDTEEITGYQEWNGEHLLEKNMVVKPGATLVVNKGANIVFSGQSLRIRVEGSLFIKGSVKEHVNIGRDTGTSSFSISSELGSHVVVHNAEISHGGTAAYIIGAESSGVAHAANYQGVIQVNGGTADIQNVTFRENTYAVIVSSATAKVRVNRSRFIDNKFDVEARTGNDFRYNWWGASEGPKQICYSYNAREYCYYEKIYGGFDHSFPLQQEVFKDPVLIIPGVLGSYPVSYHSDGSEATWTLDPNFQTYRDLLDSLRKNSLDGYVYDFPYDWRESNISNASLLREKIQKIKEERNWPVVDIVAHSMGGLLARQYIESDEYQDDIDQLVTLGTPQFGSPEAYLKWDGAKWFLSTQEIIQKFIFKQWAEHEGYADIFDYIHHKPITSVEELLPVYNYLHRWNGSDYVEENYGDGYPRNTFLENLNASANVQKLLPVEFTKIVGKIGDDESTIAGFDVINADKGKYWQHGFPNDIDAVFGKDGLRHSDGDATVPLFSALSNSIPSAYTITLDGVAHNDLPTESQDEILDILGVVGPYEKVQMPKIKKMLAFFIYSPVDIQIVSPSDKKVGKNFETGEVYDDIPGAFYTGYHTENEFVTIPNPEDGEYRVLTQGTGNGPYRIEIADISESDQSDEPINESTIILSGIAELQAMTEEKIKVAGKSVTLEQTDIVPPTTEAVVTGTLGLNDWYTSDAALSLTATDAENGSGIEKTEYSINDEEWMVYAEPLHITTEGTTSVRYRSIDKAGNQEEIKTKAIKIDKTAPEAKIAFDVISQKLEITGNDDQSEVSVVVMEKPEMSISNKKIRHISPWFSRWRDKHQKDLPDILAILTDEAGHATSLSFENTRNRNGFIFVRLLSVGYDGEETEIQDADITYKWKTDRKGSYQIFGAFLRNGESRLESHYLSKKDETWIMEKSESLKDDNQDDVLEQRPVRMKLSGIIAPYMETKEGELSIGY